MSAPRRIGSGPPLLLLNGYAATNDDWDPTFLEALASEHELICPDLPGIGARADEPASSTIAAMAMAAAAVLDRARVESAAVLGWSMGGFVAQELAAAHPGRVDALILLATDPGGAEAIRCPPEIWARLTDHEGTPAEQASRLIGLLFPPDFAAVVEAQFGEVVAAARARLDPAALTAQEQAMDRWHAEHADARLAAISAPALIASGTEDAVIPAANAELLARALDGAWLAPFAGGGHAFEAQEPKRLARLIGAFLNRPGAAPRSAKYP